MNINFIPNKQITAFILLLLLQPMYTLAQDNTLRFQTFLQQVLQEHPLAKQAQLQTELGNAERMAALSLFDPVLESDLEQKQMKGKQYYSLFDTKLRIPTWFGLSVVAAYENTEGEYLNPQNNTATYGLWYAGIEANVLQGLLIDKRRAALQQAKIYQELTTNQRKQLLNQLVYAASVAYINWQMAEQTQQVVEESIELAEQYFEGTRQAFAHGEKPAIDTLEAHLIVQDRIAIRQANAQEVLVAKWQLSNFLFNAGKNMQLAQGTKAEEGVLVTRSEQSVNLDTVVHNNLELQEKQLVLQTYQVDQKLKKDKLKPKLKLKFNPLLATEKESIAPSYSSSDFKWGFSFSMPLFLRGERADIKKYTVKVEQKRMEIQNKQAEISNKLQASRSKQVLLAQQLRLQQQNLVLYKRLLDAEKEKLFVGESSVFLLNKRQEKYLQGQIKRISLQAKLQVEVLNYAFYSNAM